MTQRTIKVLHIITKMDWGGAQENTLLTVQGLRGPRFEVHLASSPGGDWEHKAREIADRYFVIPSMRRGIYLLKNARAFLELFDLVRSNHYDVVHTHSTNAGLLGRAAAKLAGVPVIVHTVHGFGFEDQTFSRLARNILIQLERFAGRITDRLIMQAKRNAHEAVEMRIAPKEKVITIYSGINLNRFHQSYDTQGMKTQLNIPRDSFVVGWVGRMTEQNAPRIFLKAAKSLSEMYPNFHFLMVGDGHLRSYCEEMSRGNSQIFFTGYRSEIHKMYEAMDVLVSTVRWAGLGRTITEAMASGLPVISTGVNGVPEIVEDGVTGLIIPDDAPDAIVSAVKNLFLNPDLRGKLAENAREIVTSVFSVGEMIEQTKTLYLNILKEKNQA